MRYRHVLVELFYLMLVIIKQLKSRFLCHIQLSIINLIAVQLYDSFNQLLFIAFNKRKTYRLSFSLKNIRLNRLLIHTILYLSLYK
mgnify:CR=1 FL=1